MSQRVLLQSHGPCEIYASHFLVDDLEVASTPRERILLVTGAKFVILALTYEGKGLSWGGQAVAVAKGNTHNQ